MLRLSKAISGSDKPVIRVKKAPEQVYESLTSHELAASVLFS